MQAKHKPQWQRLTHKLFSMRTANSGQQSNKNDERQRRSGDSNNDNIGGPAFPAGDAFLSPAAIQSSGYPPRRIVHARRPPRPSSSPPLLSPSGNRDSNIEMAGLNSSSGAAVAAPSPPQRFVFDFGDNSENSNSASDNHPPVFDFCGGNDNNRAVLNNNVHSEGEDSDIERVHSDHHDSSSHSSSASLRHDHDGDDESMPSLEDVNTLNNNYDNLQQQQQLEETQRGAGGNYNRFDAFNRDDDHSSSTGSSTSSDDGSSSIPPLMNRDNTSESYTSSSSSSNDGSNHGMDNDNNAAAAAGLPRFAVGGGAAAPPFRDGQNNRRNNARRARRQQQQQEGGPFRRADDGARAVQLFNQDAFNQLLNRRAVPNEEVEEDNDDDDSLMNDDDHIHFLDDDDDDDEGGERPNNDGTDFQQAIPPGFRRFMEDTGGAGGIFGGGRQVRGGGGGPQGFPGFIAGRAAAGGGPGNDDDWPPFIPPFLRNILNMHEMGGGGERGGDDPNNRNEDGRSRRQNSIVKPDGYDSDDGHSDGDDENFNGVCSGADRCAACFRGDDQTHTWRRLVTLPCCGTDGKEDSSSTRFCASCMLRMATTTRSEDPAVTGEYDRWDDERYEYPVKKFYSKDNLETESRRFIECPRCRNLLLVKIMGLRTVPNDDYDDDDDTDDEDACDCSDCMMERRRERANQAMTKTASSIAITKPPFKLKSLYIGRRRGIAKLLWRLLHLHHGFIHLEALGGEDQKTNVLKLITWGVLERVPGKNNDNIYRMDKKDQALLSPLLWLSKNASEKDKDRQKELYACIMMDTFFVCVHFLKKLRPDRSLRMFNQLGVQILAWVEALPRLPLTPGQTLVVTAWNIYSTMLILQLSVILVVYLFFFGTVGYGVFYGMKRADKTKHGLRQQAVFALWVCGLGVTCYAVIRKVTFSLLYGLLFPKVISVIHSIHQTMLRSIVSSIFTLYDFLLPDVGSVLEYPAVYLVTPYILVGVYYCFNVLVAFK